MDLVRMIFGKGHELLDPKQPPPIPEPVLPSKPPVVPLNIPINLRSMEALQHGEHRRAKRGGDIYICPHRDSSEPSVVVSLTSIYGQRPTAVVDLSAKECRDVAAWLMEAAEIIETDPLKIGRSNDLKWDNVPDHAIESAINRWFKKPPLLPMSRKDMIDFVTRSSADRYSDFRNYLREAMTT